ncbi:fumarylacetoacetate hydrolase family protein [Pseudonocardia sp. RS010]|uniref:fumarylacetoacetate hydrolase family protein n=1 Tax=Pseudonocardia sp. RS010 TaxID=3385979 RepID=UPI0039A356E7
MKLCTAVDASSTVRIGVLHEGASLDVTDQVPPGLGSPMRRLLASGQDLTTLRLDGPPLDTSRLLAPVPDPSKIVAAPVNYVDHQVEMSQASHIDSLGVFLKAPSSLTGDRGLIELPYHDRRFDQEGELAVIIGRRASHVPAERARDHIAGYTCLLDMTMRGGEDRSVRKSFDTFTPCGPHLVTPDEVGDLDELELHTWVSGQLRQRADIADLIWGVPALIEYVSSVMVLEPGDIVSTGTPAGVGEVHDGDEVTVEITSVGRLTATVTDSGAVACPTLGKDSGPKPPARLTPVSERDRS